MADKVTYKSLADVLIEKQIITPQQRDETAADAASRGLTFDDALIESGMMSAEDVQAIYSDLFQIRFLKLEDVEIDPEAIHYIPGAIARRFHLVPVRRTGNALAIAMAEPTNREAIAALRAVTDFDLLPFAARLDAIQHAVYIHYGESHDGVREGDETEDRFEGGVAPSPESDDISHVGRGLSLIRGANFASFVEDPANQFALSIAKSVASFRVEEGYNPFHCWGGRGCGKTHLLHAIAADVQKRFPIKRCILTTGQRLIDNLFECIRDNKVNFFRYLYRELDLLLIDDAEPLIRHPWAQREMLETMKHSERNTKQIVIAARVNLAAEPQLIQDLRHTLEAGVIAGIGRYSAEGKRGIVRSRMGRANLSDDVLDCLSAQCGDDLTDLLSVSEQVIVTSLLEGQEIAPSAVEEIARMQGITMTDDSPDRIRQFLTQQDRIQTAQPQEQNAE